MLDPIITGRYCAPQPFYIMNGGRLSEYKSFFKKVGGNEGDKCLYNVRMDTYGCGCQHDCKYCYAKSLLSFRGLWDANNPRIADINKIKKQIQKIPSNTVIRLGGMTDCFQPLEINERITYETIKELNKYKINYLVVTKSHLIASSEYMEILDKNLAHIQISVTCLNDDRAIRYENASVPSKRIKAILDLQNHGYDVSIRLSPLIGMYMDFEKLSSLNIDKCVIEFLRVNSWIKQWCEEIDFKNYKVHYSNYYHLTLEDKICIVDKINISSKTVCEDVTDHFIYWRDNVNPNKSDCCNLRL